MKYTFIIAFLFLPSLAFTQIEEGKKSKLRLGADLSINYSFSGFGVIGAVDLIKGNNMIYIGPKIITSRNYLPNKGPWGVNVGYRHEFRNVEEKVLSFFFLTDYQMLTGKAFSHIAESAKRNYYHELFVGYGLQFRIAKGLYLGNAMGIGAHMEVFNNVDLNWKQTYFGFNNLFRVFVHYKF